MMRATVDTMDGNLDDAVGRDRAREDRERIRRVKAPFAGRVTCSASPLGALWVRWHLAANANVRISPVEAFDALGPWGMMRELARARRAA